MARYQLTHEKPFAHPAYLIAYAVGKKGMSIIPAVSWVKELYREDVFINYTGTWSDTMNVVRMYMGVSE